MLGFTIQIIFIEQDSEGEICDSCGKEIKNKKWVMMLDFADPVNHPPSPLGKVYCVICKINMEKD